MGILVIIIALALAGGVVVGTVKYFQNENNRILEEQKTSFRSAVMLHLKKGVKMLDYAGLTEEYGVSEEIAAETAATLYAGYCKKVFADAKVTDTERRQLDLLQRVLIIPRETAYAIEANAADQRYRDAALGALADGLITQEEAMELERLRAALGLSENRALECVGAPAWDGYLALFRRVIEDGRITIDELEELQRYRKALGISREQANNVIREDVLGLYRQWFYNIMQDGKVTPEEEQGLAWLKSEFGLDDLDTGMFKAQLNELKVLAAYREGQLPTVRTSKLLEGGEICHWDGPCQFIWETATQRKGANGQFVVTSKQLMFSSSIRSFSFSPSKILDIQIFSDALVIRSSSSRGTGTYRLASPRVVEAILIGLVRKHKYQTCANYSSDLTRHIPDLVRREVWHRDGGRCVRCGASDYLEYDHIIPHAKGGANTVGNVQLLCRRCNNEKSDRI